MALRGDGDDGASSENPTGFPNKYKGWLEFFHLASIPSESGYRDSYSDDEDEDEDEDEEVILPGSTRIKRIESYYGLVRSQHTMLILKSGDTYRLTHPYKEIRRLVRGQE